MARPTTYTPELGDQICEWIVQGQSLNSICKMDGMPALKVVYSWFRENPEFSNNYTRAKDDQADTYADKISDIADDTLKGIYKPDAARVAIDALKWTASKLKPRKYGDKLDMTSDGKPVSFIVTRGGKDGNSAG